MPNNFQIINIKGSSIEAKRNSDGKFVFRDALNFKFYHRKNHPVVNVEIRNTGSSSTAANQTTSVSDVRKRRTLRKAQKPLTYNILGEPVDGDTMPTNQKLTLPW